VDEELIIKGSELEDDSDITANMSMFDPRVSSGRSALRTMAHPVTAVFCDEYGIINFGRHEAPPLPVNALDAARSRAEALRRAEFVWDKYGSLPLESIVPMSTTGIGLSPRQIVEQTLAAVAKSEEIDAKRKERELQLERKYHLTPISDDPATTFSHTDVKDGSLEEVQVRETIDDLDRRGEYGLRDIYEDMAKKAGLFKHGRDKTQVTVL